MLFFITQRESERTWPRNEKNMLVKELDSSFEYKVQRQSVATEKWIIHDVTSVKYNKENEIVSQIVNIFPRLNIVKFQQNQKYNSRINPPLLEQIFWFKITKPFKPLMSRTRNMILLDPMNLVPLLVPSWVHILQAWEKWKSRQNLNKCILSDIRFVYNALKTPK